MLAWRLPCASLPPSLSPCRQRSFLPFYASVPSQPGGQSTRHSYPFICRLMPSLLPRLVRALTAHLRLSPETNECCHE